MKTEKQKNVYVQPACQVFQVQPSSILCASDGTPSSSTEEFNYGSTDSWF